MAEYAKWWGTLPPDVQSLLNLVQVYVDRQNDVTETLSLDVKKLRRNNRDLNAVIDHAIEAEDEMYRAVREYRRAGGNSREVPK